MTCKTNIDIKDLSRIWTIKKGGSHRIVGYRHYNQYGILGYLDAEIYHRDQHKLIKDLKARIDEEGNVSINLGVYVKDKEKRAEIESELVQLLKEYREMQLKEIRRRNAQNQYLIDNGKAPRYTREKKYI